MDFWVKFYLQQLVLRSQDSMSVHGASRSHRGDVVVTIKGVQLHTETQSVDWQQLDDNTRQDAESNHSQTSLKWRVRTKR